MRRLRGKRDYVLALRVWLEVRVVVVRWLGWGGV